LRRRNTSQQDGYRLCFLIAAPKLQWNRFSRFVTVQDTTQPLQIKSDIIRTELLAPAVERELLDDAPHATMRIFDVHGREYSEILGSDPADADRWLRLCERAEGPDDAGCR